MKYKCFACAKGLPVEEEQSLGGGEYQSCQKHRWQVNAINRKRSMLFLAREEGASEEFLDQLDKEIDVLHEQFNIPQFMSKEYIEKFS